MCKCLPGYRKVWNTSLYWCSNLLYLCCLHVLGRGTVCLVSRVLKHNSTWNFKCCRMCLCTRLFHARKKCEPCPPDLFQSTLGGACTLCPLNVISAPDSDSQTDCFCKACFSGADCEQCSLCKEAQWKDTDGNGMPTVYLQIGQHVCKMSIEHCCVAGLP
jgi:hypothetical protein